MLSFFPRDVLDEIWDLIESVSEGIPTFFLYPAIQLVELIMYTKYELFILFCSEDIIDKNCREKEKRTNKGKLTRRKPVHNPTIQLVIVSLYTKHELSNLNSG